MAAKYVALIRGINVGKAKRVAMSDLRDAGVYTYVVGIDDETIPYHLNQMASEGGTAFVGCDPGSTTPSCYTQAATQAELSIAVSAVVQRAIDGDAIFSDGFETGDSIEWSSVVGEMP